MAIEPRMTVADIATQQPTTIRVFERRRIDFCCGGRRPLADACLEHGLQLADVMAELEAAVAGTAPPARSWAAASLAEITEHILRRYHDTLREELPRLERMMDKVLDVHRGRHSELRPVADAFVSLRGELVPHMAKEEQVLFPYVLRLEGLAAAGERLVGSPFGSVENPIRVMEADHEQVGRTLALLRGLTDGYLAPPDACNTFRGLYHGLGELERELHEHIHLENNVHFPRAVELEAKLRALSGN